MAMHCFDDMRGIWRREGPVGRAVIAAMLVAAVIYGGSKPGMRSIPPPNEEPVIEDACFTDAEQSLGIACVTNPAAIAGFGFRVSGLAAFEATSNAVAKASWLATGVFDDYFTLTPPADASVRIGTNDVRRLMVFSHGYVKAVLENKNAAWLAPFRAPMSFIAQGKWSECGVTSCCWTVSSPASTIVAWENALLERDTARPLSFQIEFLANGNFTYRYGGTDAIDTLTNATFSIGSLRGSAPLCECNSITGAIARSTSLHFADISAYGDGTGDADGDGLTDYAELMILGSNPHESDTDGDGLDDLAELGGGTNPLSPDTDGDGVPDGWSREQYTAHRLLNWQEGDRTATITLQASTPASNRAVLRIGDMPILLCETNSWALSIPTGTVWNVELRTGGLPVRLAFEAGAGLFAENADSIFASCLLEEDRQTNLRSVPPGPQPDSDGSSGGSAKFYAPCIFLEPVSQVVHCGESAEVRARCVPDTPSLSGKLVWSVDPADMAGHVSVAGDKLSATVSGLCPDFPYVMLHADIGYALTTAATVHYCGGHDNCPTNYVNFPPNHTNATINPVFRECEHPFDDDEDDPKIFLEVEVGREAASGWQHLAWVDTDPDAAGVQRRTAISRDNPPTINWNGKATSSAPLSNGTDAHVYDSNTTFARALPAVAAGQYVPPPFATVISRTFDDNGELISEFSTTLSVPQYVQITWDAAVIEEFRQPITFNYVGIEGDAVPSTNVTLFAGCSASNGTDAFKAIPSKIQTLFPANVNIVFVGPDAEVPQPHKTIIIQSGRYTNPATGRYTHDLGRTPNEHCHQRNDSPSGTAYVYDRAIRESLSWQYEAFYLDTDESFNPINDWNNVPLPLSADLIADYIAQVALHESCHSMGIVPTASATQYGHNVCNCGRHFMDSGRYRWPPVYLGFISSHIQRWMQKNMLYLEFVFPSTPQGGAN